MTKIAVLLPVYRNDKVKYLQLAVESIIQQRYRDYHLYIGVDGPIGDDIKEYLNLLENQSKISIVPFKENRGLACILDDLLEICKKNGYQYIARMDADDVSLPDRLNKQVKFLDSHPEVDVVGGAIEEVDSNGMLKGKRIEYPLIHDDCRKFFRYRDPLAHPAVMFKKSYFEKVPFGYRKEYRKNQDTMLWFDGFMNGCIFANLPDTLLHFRVNDDFYNRRKGWKRAKQMLGDRWMMNKALHYDLSANLFAIAMFFMTISPAWVKKFLYKIR